MKGTDAVVNSRTFEAIWKRCCILREKYKTQHIALLDRESVNG